MMTSFSDENVDKTTPLLSSQRTSSVREKLPYPKAALFILLLPFGVYFFYISLLNILILYLTQELLYDDNEAINIYHALSMATFFVSILGAILADNVLGKFRTISYMLILTIFGCLILTMASVPNFLPMRLTTMVSLIVICIGIGAVQPCLRVFGGDQFQTNQKIELRRFFSHFSISLRFGSMLSMILVPIFRAKIHCFGESTCYPLAFGFNLIILILTLVIFLIGYPTYKINPISGSVLLNGIKCIMHAVARKIKLRKVVIKNHWLDYADDEFDSQTIFDMKVTLRVVLILLTSSVIVAFTLLRGSSFILQATKLQNTVLGFKIEPDQLSILMPIIGIMSVPVFEYVVYPICNKCNLLNSTLQRIIFSSILILLAFAAAGFLQLSIEKNSSNCNFKNNLIFVNKSTPYEMHLGIRLNSTVRNGTQNWWQDDTLECKPLSILLQIPQYVLLSIGEIIYAISIIEFAYKEAPENMRSIVQAFLFVNVAFANFIILIIQQLKFLTEDSYRLFFYFGLGMLDIIVLIVLSYNYKYRNDVIGFESPSTKKRRMP
ncbi:peptide transporter family 1-like [Centruroides vittatus]|uniref:peptide transporter family 1-like n=1 Tax=Centruroides vittatus TaxID=120091 RepID=UPI00350F14AA